ncbi:class E sortase [Demequina sp. TTPB684]|uniref:class E sortase n=1 Tax=unclassified Demequina TaxID=2620311 RepID=UPI001CF5A9FE|nr:MULTISPECIES: class E sortase [unclassified Demequina]MCB2412637.1 class E sortase [Demequina sp. TTPB684]UPU87922.1 class E sortase [Demequina sp. TMPB413]
MTVHRPPAVDSPTPVPARPERSAVDRAFVVIGETLVTVGVVLGLFVVWQLFYTDVQSGRTQAAALDDLAFPETARVEASGDAGAADEAPTIVQLIPDELKVYSPDGAPVLASQAEATTFGALHVPRWGYDYVKPISEGTDRARVLDSLGIGHYSDTAMPGAVGNFAVAGHRTTYGKPFTSIEKLEVGDALVVQTEAAWFVYRVTDSEIVAPTYTAAIAPTPREPGVAPTAASITLTTCHPRYSAEQRYVVYGQLEYWAPTGHGYPSEIVEGA